MDISIPQLYVEKIVAMLGDIAIMKGSLQEKKRVLMTALSKLIDADGWLWSATQVINEQDRPVSCWCYLWWSYRV